MLGRIIEIIDNQVFIKLDIDINNQTNLINLHVVFDDDVKKIIGEIVNMLDDIEKYEKNHVLYRVTPIFKGDNLLASGVEIEAYSVEDNGKGICFNVYVYNVQPGITIDYKTGRSWKN